jgi:sterol desaturase/sphingolipid hydroxylase (fatty acid hydroxylase superfamily)
MFYYTLIPFGVHMITYWSLGFIFYLLDLKYLDASSNNWKKYNNAISTSLFNQFFITLPTLYFLNSHIKKSIETSTNDTIPIIGMKLFLIINISNIIFYLLHRLLHYNKAYKYIHSIHHEFVEPVAVAAFYAHPIEHLFANTLSFLIPFIIFGTTYNVMIILIVIGTIQTILAHSTYISKSNDHIIHHKKYKYNFGFSGYIDRIFQTYTKN